MFFGVLSWKLRRATACLPCYNKKEDLKKEKQEENDIEDTSDIVKEKGNANPCQLKRKQQPLAIATGVAVLVTVGVVMMFTVMIREIPLPTPRSVT